MLHLVSFCLHSNLPLYKSRKFKLLVKNKATGTSHGVFIYSPYWLLVIIVYEESNIIISVGLSALLVSTNRAMREPFYRGTSDSTGSTSEPELNFSDIDYQYVISGSLMR